MDEAPELLSRWRDGDAEAGDRLLRLCFTSLHRFFNHKVEGGVDDLIQRTLLDCLEGGPELRDPGHFRAYLFRIARNRLFDRLRQERRLGPQVDLSELSLRDLGASPSSLLAEQQRARVLTDALRGLPLEAQIALELTYWEGLSAPQIASVLGINESTVRSRVTRARDALKRELREHAALGFADEPMLR